MQQKFLQVLTGPSTQKLKADFQSLDHPDSKKVYIYVEQVWPELEGPQTDRQDLYFLLI